MPVELLRRDRWKRKAASRIVVCGLSALLSRSVASAESASSKGPKTATPIKHLIVVIRENRTFDNLYATYVPKRGQHIWNLLSRGIVNAARPDPTGTPPGNSRSKQSIPFPILLVRKPDQSEQNRLLVSGDPRGGRRAAANRNSHSVPE
jgi:hypothetical protein